jgi:hypothetical protein
MSATLREDVDSPRVPRDGHVHLPVSLAPQLIVVVDTEEEFDWTAPFSRASTSVSAMQQIGRVQSVFDRYGVRPSYLVDFPVATQPVGYEPLQDIFRDRRCTIGAHLHPWVTPPHEEAVNGRNSYTCNLPIGLQRAKLATLTQALTETFEPPRVFKAGRYGLDRKTVGLLDEFGFQADNSVNPRMDFSADSGPSFTANDPRPFFLTPTLLEIPCTTDYVGWSGSSRESLHRLASHPALARMRAVGVLARTRCVNRIMLSPEGNSFVEMRTLTRALFARGMRSFTLSFHSPSVEPGHTPYVRTDSDLAAFIDCIDRYCEFFLRELGGVPTTPLEFRRLAMSCEERVS